MIRFSLRCRQGHDFESWFRSGDAYEALRLGDHVICPECGSSDVEKSLMAPAVNAGTTTPEPAREPGDAERRLQELRAYVEANSDYVGPRFAEEARAMYLGDMPDRPIHGEAGLAEARALLEDGVPVLPLPIIPPRKTN